MPKTCPKHGITLTPKHGRYDPYWICSVPNCTVRCGSGPHSTPADAETRQARQTLFNAIERRAKTKHKRARLYGAMAESLNLPRALCHLGMFDVERCQLAMSWLVSKSRYTKKGRLR